MPPAPGRLSTTIDCPSAGTTCSAIERATVSLPPSGGNGTMSRIGFAGQVCAQARPAVKTRKAAAIRRVLFMVLGSESIGDADVDEVWLAAGVAFAQRRRDLLRLGD